MAITENKYTGNGSTVLYSFTFPYLDVPDIKVSLDGVLTTAYTLANATQIRFNAAPANGVAIRLYRQTNDESLNATFYPGSAIRAQDLNDNFTQNLYVTQESSRDAGDSVGNANEALAKANTAISTANTANSTANTAISTANNAASDAAAAVVTANAAEALAITADNNATAAINAVAGVVQYVPVPNVAAIPIAPNNGDAVEVVDSTGIESFSPLAFKPPTFVGDSGLGVRIQYTLAGSTWNWLGYYANDSETRYVKTFNLASQAEAEAGTDNTKWMSPLRVKQYVDANGGGGGPGDPTIPPGNTILVDGDIGVTVQAYDADTAKLDVAQTFTAVQTLTDPAIIGTISEDIYTITDGAAFEVDPSNGSVQLITLGANRTPKATNFAAGESITLMVDDGTNRTLTWTDATWGGSGVVWTGGSAPTLATTGYTTIQFWKVGSQVYGAYVGDVV